MNATPTQPAKKTAPKGYVLTIKTKPGESKNKPEPKPEKKAPPTEETAKTEPTNVAELTKIVSAELTKHEDLELTANAPTPKLAAKIAAEKPEPATKKAPEPKPETPEISKGALSKVRRAFQKAGKPIDEKAIAEYAKELTSAGIKIMDCRSSRIAKVLRGELDVKELTK